MNPNSEWLDDVIQAYKELGVKEAHRSRIITKVREIRERKGLHLGQYDKWVQYTLQHYSRGKAGKTNRDYFEPVKLGSGRWKILIDC